MNFLKLTDTDFIDIIYNNCSYIFLLLLRETSKSQCKSLDNNVSANAKIKINRKYFDYVKNTKIEINNFIESLNRFRNQIMNFDVFIQFYPHEVIDVDCSISYFIFLYYREFNVNIINCGFPCPYCNKFNFLEYNDIAFLCQICDCKDAMSVYDMQTVKSNFHKKFLQDYTVVVNLDNIDNHF